MLRFHFTFFFLIFAPLYSNFLTRMKLKTIFSSLLLLAVVFLITSCDDNMNELGTSIQPSIDKISVGMDTLTLSAKTVQFDSIFGKTKNPVLGEYQDPVYGTIRSDYLGELYIPEGSAFPEDAVVDSVKLGIFYNSWVGDSISPMEVSVYEINKMLPQSTYYTNFDSKEYYDNASLLGKSMFTASNLEVSEEERNEKGYYHRVFVTLSDELGERFLAESKKGADSRLLNSYKLRTFFHGLYVNTSFGSSTVLQTDYTLLNFHYHYVIKNGSSEKKDTTVTRLMQLSFSPEVTQINHIENKNAQLLADNTTQTFLKSPAGVYTEITFPFSQIEDKLNSRALNLASFSVNAVPDQSELKFNLKPPTYLLLLNKDSLEGFFSKRKMFDNVTSYYATFDATNYVYDFKDISAMINHYKKEATNNGTVSDLTYVLIPVNVGFTQVNQGYSTVPIPSSVSNLMMPHATALHKAPESLNLKLIFSNF